MSGQRWWIATTAALLAAVCVLFTGHPSSGQPGIAPANPTAPGRYQMETTGAAPSSTVFVLDTHTGEVWYRQTVPGGEQWTSMGSPRSKPDKR